MNRTWSPAPFIAAALLLLPAIYIGCYLALVDPPSKRGIFSPKPYRYGGQIAAVAFWPLEQADRKLRPEKWDPGKMDW
jgi:hypothetical protein